jgi:hypothetical protein
VADNTGVDAQVLSLPKGGGAVQGLGATFETDLNTGTGSYSVSLNLPAGPNGIRPELSLRYHSAAGNGPFGIGWTLGTLSVCRKIDGRIPTYGSEDDEFVLTGVEDLVALGGRQYRPLVDTLHWRIRRQDDGWELTDTRGTRHLAGATAQARVETIDNGQLKQACWLLESVQDSTGNSSSFTYRAEGAQRYLERIDWGTYSLRFAYEDRPDPLTSGR